MFSYMYHHMVVYILISMYYFYIKSISIKTPRVCMSRAATIYGNCQVFQGLSIMLSIFIHPAQWTILIKHGHCNSQNLILLVQKLTFPHLIYIFDCSAFYCKISYSALYSDFKPCCIAYHNAHHEI